MDQTLAVSAVVAPGGEQAATQISPPPVTDWLMLSRQAYEGSTTYLDTNLRAQWERNLRQWQSKHPIGSKYLSESNKGKPKFFRPKTRAAIRKHEASAAAAYFSTQDVVDIEAQDDSKNMQRASAALWKEVVNHRLTKSVAWFMTVMGAYQDTMVMGAVVSHQDWDAERDKPDPRLVPLENMRIDPACDWLDPMGTSPYVIELIPMYIYEVRERSERPLKPWHAVSDKAMLAARAQSYDSTRLTRDGNRTDATDSGQTGITDFDIVWVHRVIMRRKGVDQVFYTLGTEALLSDPVPLKEDYPWLRKFERPYVMGICVIEAHRNYPSGLPELTAQTVAEINDLANARMENVHLVLRKRYFVKRHKQVDIRSLTRGTAGSVTMLDDPEKDVKELNWNDVTQSSYQEQDRLNLDHDDLTGNFNQSTVQANRKLNETVGGMNLANSGAQEIGDYTLKTFTETWMEPALSQILRMEQYRESDETVLLMAGKKADLVEKFGVSEINDELLRQELTLTLDIGMGATNPLNNLEKFMAALANLEKVFGVETVAARLDFDAVSSEVFGKLGFKDGSRFMLDQEDPRVGSLMRTIEELKQKLAQKRSPEVDAAQAGKLRAETMKVIVEAFFGATQGAELVASIPEIAAVADKILEAAGYTPPNPPGIDPNIPVPADGAVGAPTGATATGAAAANKYGVPTPRPNTSPQLPAVPASAIAGVNNGIEGGDA